MKKYALLDTDFISKTHSVQDGGDNHLIDRVMELPEYVFFCHAQIVTELNTTKGIYYYTTYDNHQITAVDMYAENLDSDKLIRYPIILNGEIRWHNK